MRVRVWPRPRGLLEAFEAADVVVAGGVGETTLVVADPGWLVRLVMAQSGGLEVVAPAEVRAQVREAALSALRRLA